MGDETRDEDEVERTTPRHLIGDVESLGCALQAERRKYLTPPHHGWRRGVMSNKRVLPLIVAALVVTLLFLGVWTKRGQGGAAVRQPWEYKLLTYVDEGTKTTLFEDGRQVPGQPVSRVPELGSQGWELVAVAAVPWTSGGGGTAFFRYSYWFKRPK
jgi:hypothetical protein